MINEDGINIHGNVIDNKATYRKKGRKIIFGRNHPAFLHRGDTYYLTDISVYADGMIYCWEWVTIEEFKEKLLKKEIVTKLPENAQISLHLILHCNVSNILYKVPESEFFKDVLDTIEELNGRATSIVNFIKAKKQFWENQTPENKELYHNTFKNMPAHKMKYVLGGRDKKYFREIGIKVYELVYDLDDHPDNQN